MALILTPTISTTTKERMKEKFDGFRQTIEVDVDVYSSQTTVDKVLSEMFYSF